MTLHLSSNDIAQYVQGTSPPAEALRVDDHLAACAACRQLASSERMATGVAAMREMVRSDSVTVEHPTHEQIVAYVDAGLDEIDREIIEAHLDTCGMCAADVDDLRAVALSDVRSPQRAAPHVSRPGVVVPMRSRRLMWYAPAGLAAAAAIVAAVLVWNAAGGRPEAIDTRVSRAPENGPASKATAAPSIVVALTDGVGTVTLDVEGRLTGAPALEPNDRDALIAAVKSGVVPIPPAIVTLRGRPGTLLGASTAAAAFQPRGPVATAVDSQRPVFEWTAFPNATSYVVSVFDANLDKVAESQPQSALRWTPSQPLPRGRTYAWQIRARTATEDAISPTPPAPEAQFGVLTQAEADRVERVRRDHAGSPLTLGVLLAGAGLLDEAERQLEKVVAANPSSPLAQQLLASVQSSRRAGR